MIITSLKNSSKTANLIAKKLKCKCIETEIKTFPDGDIYLRYKSEIKNKKLIIVESFQPNSNEALYNIVFAGKTAKDLGAKQIILVAPYLAFMRQDKRFNSGEAINAKIMSELINNSVDKIITVDPHLHRIRKMSDIFKIKSKRLTANQAIGNFIEKNFKNEVIMGPDWESYQWADEIAKIAKTQSTCLEKTRHSYRDVDVKLVKEIPIKGKNVIIVDDIISTGNTMIKAAIKAKKLGAKSVSCVGIHGLFVENALKKMKKHFNNIFTVNTIEHNTNKIDITDTLIKEIKKK
ncbi:ribose-phosphate diphosphokinase [Candidatus Woesearchaeota archaeon]|nr:ribose-phosphate diphosphokinase [Candidatus Woesearchaeota archaeon]